MKLFKPALAMLLVSSLAVVNANAIGKREQGALMGAGILLLLPTLSQNMGNLFGAQNTQPVVVHHEPVVRKEIVYVERAPQKRRYANDRYNDRRYDRHYDRYEPYTRKTIIIER
ncbi:hypothetical protein JWV37_08905 [Sulfurospirillum sp. T05]|uniref:Uncharacterized protein n=1 Tax=Sulfurospirillum tamanense TaxID=2813362 RepID=A0ABS2WTD2_9BACT|nr:hypothetical protein [Sulfurospirillum tamanensis]MBN2964900.1 hypothetical protein [Sulfurospirillum tamanensis]